MSKLKRPASSRARDRRCPRGRATRAVINELFDFGRPASVTLAVLVDRGGRELPIQPAFSAARIALPRGQRLSLARDEQGHFSFDIKDAA